MKFRKTLAIGSVLVAAAVGLGLTSSLGGADGGDDPVRVYLVHGLIETPRTGTTTMMNDGITVVSPGNYGNTWPTQIVGFLEDMDEHWVVIRKAVEDGKLEVHIPRERVQLIEEIDGGDLHRLLKP